MARQAFPLRSAGSAPLWSSASCWCVSIAVDRACSKSPPDAFSVIKLQTHLQAIESP